MLGSRSAQPSATNSGLDDFEAFYREHFDAVLAFMVRRLGSAEVALDLTAEAFAQALVARRRFRGESAGEAQAWIYQIARRQLTRYLRRGKLERRALTRLGIEVPQLDEDAQERVEQLADLEGFRGALRSGLSNLSEPNRRALQLRVVEELPYSRVAAELGITEPAARLRVSRGLNRLAEALENNPTAKEQPR